MTTYTIPTGVIVWRTTQDITNILFTLTANMLPREEHKWEMTVASKVAVYTDEDLLNRVEGWNPHCRHEYPARWYYYFKLPNTQPYTVIEVRQDRLEEVDNG